MSISMCLNQDYSLNLLRSGREFQNVYLFDLIHNLKHHLTCVKAVIPFVPLS